MTLGPESRGSQTKDVNFKRGDLERAGEAPRVSTARTKRSKRATVHPAREGGCQL